jgi:hypothetical protein
LNILKRMKRNSVQVIESVVGYILRLNECTTDIRLCEVNIGDTR